MTRMAPQWAFSALAMDATGNPFPRPGTHFRAYISSILGLPIAPLLVYRFSITNVVKSLQDKHDVVWVDARGAVRTTPFDVTADNPVTGYFPAGAECCWVGLDAVGTPVLPAPPAPPRRLAVRPAFFTGGFSSSSELLLDAMLNTPRGAASIGSTTTPPWQLAASHIDHVVVSRSGRVNGITWLNASDLRLDDSVWRLMGLPRGTGARYTGLKDAEAQAIARVQRGAPQNEPLYGHPDGALIPVTPAGEWARVKPPALADIKNCLDVYVDDTSQPPDQVAVQYPVPGTLNGTMTVNALGLLLQSSLDTGFARWLGMMDFDDAPLTTTRGEVVAYVIRGIWRVPDRRPAPLSDAFRDFLRGVPTTAAADVTTLYSRFPLDWRAALAGSYLDFTAVACAIVGIPPDLLAPPEFANVESGSFLPDTPPAARREIAFDLQGIAAGATLAFARRDPGALRSLNPANGTMVLPIAPGTPSEATIPGTTRLFDRTAPPDPTAYRTAQTDWVGRWSDWNETTAPGKARPMMPAPVPMWRAATFDPAAMNSPLPLNRLIEVRVPSIDLAALPPGSNIPMQLQFFINGVLNATVAVTDPETLATIVGPVLGRSESVTVQLAAQWLDAGGQPSRQSIPIALVLTDPRTPPQVVLPATIQYGSRPDATGRSRIVMTWAASATQRRFRVFHTDETAIIGAIDRVINPSAGQHPIPSLTPGAAASLRTTLTPLATADPVTRATGFLSSASSFTREMFTQLTGAPIERPASGPVTFTHEVSGSLQVLSFYRVVAVSDASVESDFASAPMIVAAVPNTTPPARPQLSGTLSDDPVPVPVLTIATPRGSTEPTEVRVRRALGQADDPLRMSIVDTRPLPAPLPSPPPPPPAPDAEPPPPPRFEVRPAGVLRDWERYFWRVEVRGASEPGGGPDGAWSDASLPAVIATIPPPPPAATTVSATRAGADVSLRWQHPLTLRGGSMGRYKFEVWRGAPGHVETLVATVAAFPMPAAGFIATDAGAPPQSTYRIVLTDPIGRTSDTAPVMA